MPDRQWDMLQLVQGLFQRRLLLASVMVGLVAAPIALSQRASRAELRFQEAHRKETIDGDLKSAIELYRRVIGEAGGNRLIAAQALVRMGQCYEKLGDAEARKAYERVVREFSDQAEPAGLARERLGALVGTAASPPAGGVTQRLVWSTPTESWGGVSADGRWIAFQSDQGDLAIHDLVTGQNRLLTNYGPRGKRPGEAYEGVFSPDGKRVAYRWRVFKTSTAEIRAVNVDGTGERVLYEHHNLFSRVWAWTPDGSAVVADARIDELKQQILRISVSDGSVEVLREERTFGHPGSMAFSPTARFLAYTFLGRIHALDLQSPGRQNTPALLVDDWMSQLLGWSPGGSHVVFVSERSGARDAWLLPVKDGKPAGEPRLVKSGLATVNHEIWSGGNDITSMGFASTGALYYGISRRESDAMTVVLDSASGRMQGPPVRFTGGFDGSTFGLQWSPDGKWAFCQSGKMLLIRNLDSRVTREFYPREYIENARWHPDGKSLIGVGGDFTRPVFRVDLETGAASALAHDMTRSEAEEVRIRGGLLCMTLQAVLSSDGKMLYRSMAERKGGKVVGGRVVARNLGSGEEKVIHHTRQDEVTVFDIALSPDGTQLATLNYAPSGHRLYVSPVSGENPDSPPLCSARESLGETFRAIAWLPDGKSLLAGMNRPLTTGELWRIPLDGGPPQKHPLPFMSLGLHVHPDGRRIGITAWNQVSEVWALENFLPKAAK